MKGAAAVCIPCMHAWHMTAGRFDIGSIDTYNEAVKRFG